jgi:hypothetical protein
MTFSMCSVRSAEPLLDVTLLRPDAAADEFIVEVGQVHEAGEVLTKADRIDDGEPHLARWQSGQQRSIVFCRMAMERSGSPSLPADCASSDERAGKSSNAGTVN